MPRSNLDYALTCLLQKHLSSGIVQNQAINKKAAGNLGDSLPPNPMYKKQRPSGNDLPKVTQLLSAQGFFFNRAHWEGFPCLLAISRLLEALGCSPGS